MRSRTLAFAAAAALGALAAPVLRSAVQPETGAPRIHVPAMRLSGRSKRAVLGMARTRVGSEIGWRLPRPVQVRVRNSLLQQRVDAGLVLVPEAELEACYVRCLEHLDALGHERGDYLEFGVFYGSSLACMHRASGRAGWDTMRMVGFDSFEGLPVEAEFVDRGLWMAGDVRSDISFTRRFLDRQGADWSRTELVKGWFSETLRQPAADFGLRHASVILVDCDLSSSAADALRFSAPLIRSSAIVLFDDWHAYGLADERVGEKAAFEDWLAQHPEFEATPLEAYSPGSAAFLLQRIELAAGRSPKPEGGR